MNWTQKFKSILSDRNSGECPFCGSKETDFFYYNDFKRYGVL